MNAVTPIVPAADALADQPAADSLLNFVAMAVKDPAIDVTKLEALLRMQREIVADDAKVQFNRAMSSVQSEMQPVLRDADNEQTRSKYARLETIDAAIRPIYVRHGFYLSFDEVPIDGPNVRLACTVAHAAGHAQTYHPEAALDLNGPQGKPNKTPLHGLGSSVSYLRRYLTCMIFNVTLRYEDTDGSRTPNDGEIISRTQADELRSLIAVCSADPAARATNEQHVLRKLGLEKLCAVGDLPPREFTRVRNALLTKRAAMAKRATQAQTEGVAA